jgi:hypothetical protein
MTWRERVLVLLNVARSAAPTATAPPRHDAAEPIEAIE